MDKGSRSVGKNKPQVAEVTAGLLWLLRSGSVAVCGVFVGLGEQVEGVERDLRECYTFALGERKCLPAW